MEHPGKLPSTMTAEAHPHHAQAIEQFPTLTSDLKAHILSFLSPSTITSLKTASTALKQAIDEQDTLEKTWTLKLAQDYPGAYSTTIPVASFPRYQHQLEKCLIALIPYGKRKKRVEKLNYYIRINDLPSIQKMQDDLNLDLLTKADRENITPIRLLLQLNRKNISDWLKSIIYKQTNTTPLNMAIVFNDQSSIDAAIEKKVGINQQDAWGETPLFYACIKNDVILAEKLFNAGADLNHVNLYHETVLHIVIEYNCREMLIWLTAHNLNLEQAATPDSTPLCMASAAGNLDFVEILLNANANVMDARPLVLAIYHDYFEVAARLLTAGMPVNGTIVGRETALTHAIIKNEHPIIQQLLGNNPNAANLESRSGSPLIVACKHKQLMSVDLLLELNPNIDAVDRKGRTALMHASRLGLVDVIEALIRHGANLNLTDKNNASALTHAIRYKKAGAALTLIAAGANTEMRNDENDENDTLLTLAIKYKLSTVALALIPKMETKAKRNHFFTKAPDALFLAIEHKLVDVALVIIPDYAKYVKAGQKNSISSSSNWFKPPQLAAQMQSLLVLAIKKQLSTVAIAFIYAGVEVNPLLFCERQPLKSAIKRGCVDVVIELLLAGANINHIEKFNNTALAYARDCDQDEIVTLIDCYSNLRLLALDNTREYPLNGWGITLSYALKTLDTYQSDVRSARLIESRPSNTGLFSVNSPLQGLKIGVQPMLPNPTLSPYMHLAEMLAEAVTPGAALTLLENHEAVFEAHPYIYTFLHKLTLKQLNQPIPDISPSETDSNSNKI